MAYTIFPFGPMNSVRGAAMHDARVNKGKSSVIAFINEVVQLIVATLTKVWNSHNLVWNRPECI